MSAGFLEAVVAFAVYFVFVLAGLRLARQTEPAWLVVVAAFLVFPVALVAFALIGAHFNFWVFMVIYWFLVTSFLMAFGAVYKSLSLRILKDLLARPGRSDSYQRIFDHYLVADSYENRLAVIHEKGLVSLEGGRYTLSPKGAKLARNVRTVQLWFGITRSG